MIENFLQKSLKVGNINIESVARLTTGFTGADIKNLINQAGYLSIQQGEEMIKQSHIETAFDKIVMGLSKKSMFVSEAEKLKTAYHEIGHCLMSLLQKGTNKIHKVTILPRG